MEKNPYIELAECLLPEEMVEYFDVVKVEKTRETLDVTLEERNNGVEGYKPGELRPNGFYEESVVRDYPVRWRKMSFHIKRRRASGAITSPTRSNCRLTMTVMRALSDIAADRRGK